MALAAVANLSGEPLLMTSSLVSELKLKSIGDSVWNYVFAAVMSMGLCWGAACAAGRPDRKRAETIDASGNNRVDGVFMVSILKSVMLEMKGMGMTLCNMKITRPV
jgi:hypothetical protein